MAALTWREVSAPDFRGAMQGFENFSQTLNNAFNTARVTAQGIDNSITDRVNSELMLKLAAIDDPVKARTATQDLLLTGGVDPRRIRASTLAAAEGLEAKVIGETQARNAFTRTEDRYNLFTKNGDLINAFNVASMNDDQEGAGKAAAALMAAGFRAEDLSGILKGGMDFTKGGLDITGKRQDIKFDATRFGWDETEFSQRLSDRADQIEAEEAVANIFLASGGDPELIKSEFARQRGSFKGARTAAFAMSRLNEQMGGNLFAADMISAAGGVGGGDLPAGGTGGPGGLDPTRVMNYEARGVGYNVVPANVKTLGQASDFALQVNRAGADSSAMGLYQITGDTLRDFGPKVFGKNWRNVELNPANQDKIAEAIFNSSRGSATALRNRWVSLSPKEAEQVRKMPWEKARQIIARKESGGDPAKILSPGQVAQNTNRTIASVGAGVAQRDPNGTTEKFLAANGSNMSKSEAAKKLQAALPGSTFNQALTLIEQGMSRGKTNAEQAYIIYSDNIRPAEGFWRANAPTWLGGDKTGNIGDVSINDKAISAILAQTARGTYATRGADSMRQGAAIESLAAARGAYEAATARYQKAARQFELGLISEANLAVLQRDMIRAGQNVMMLNETIQGDPSIGARNLGTPSIDEIAANARSRGRTSSGGIGRPSYMIGQ